MSTAEQAPAAPAAAAAPEAAGDKFKKFEEEGVTFKAKLVGSELVMEPRGDKMCQNSIQRLKAIIKGQKVHKRRIVMKISYAGVKVCDEKTSETLYHHEVPQISFIASDDTDSRTFGYVCDVPNKAHQFVCFKTGGPALQVMSEISSLFEAVLAKKKRQEEEGRPAAAAAAPERPAALTSTPTPPDEALGTDLSVEDTSAMLAKELFLDGTGSAGAGGDSGIMDLTFNDWLPSPQQQPPAPQQPPHPHPHPMAQVGVPPLGPPPQLGPFEPKADSPFGAGSAAIPIAKPHRPAQLNFTSSSFSGSHLGGHMMSSPSAAPAMVSTPAGGPLRLAGAANKSLVYNHSSVSLNDAALSRRAPAFTGAPMSPSSGGGGGGFARQESTDKYAVFNDIDALPSIFESISSLDSASKLSNAGQQLHPGSQSMDHRQLHAAHQAQHCRQLFGAGPAAHPAAGPQYQPSPPASGEAARRMNPFDDDFFA